MLNQAGDLSGKGDRELLAPNEHSRFEQQLTSTAPPVYTQNCPMDGRQSAETSAVATLPSKAIRVFVLLRNADLRFRGARPIVLKGALGHD